MELRNIVGAGDTLVPWCHAAMVRTPGRVGTMAAEDPASVGECALITLCAFARVVTATDFTPGSCVSCPVRSVYWWAKACGDRGPVTKGLGCALPVIWQRLGLHMGRCGGCATCEAPDIDVFADGIPPDSGILTGGLAGEFVVLDAGQGRVVSKQHDHQGLVLCQLEPHGRLE